MLTFSTHFDKEVESGPQRLAHGSTKSCSSDRLQLCGRTTLYCCLGFMRLRWMSIPAARLLAGDDVPDFVACYSLRALDRPASVGARSVKEITGSLDGRVGTVEQPKRRRLPSVPFCILNTSITFRARKDATEFMPNTSSRPPHPSAVTLIISIAAGGV
jgi:hypothetical protein